MNSGILLIEKIHYYLCYQKHSHINLKYIDSFRKQRNVLYHTSLISRMLSKDIKEWSINLKNLVYFIAYILCIKYLLDIELFYIKSISEIFYIKMPKRLDYYEFFCLTRLKFDFSFLECKIDSWNIY